MKKESVENCRFENLINRWGSLSGQIGFKHPLQEHNQGMKIGIGGTVCSHGHNKQRSGAVKIEEIEESVNNIVVKTNKDGNTKGIKNITRDRQRQLTDKQKAYVTNITKYGMNPSDAYAKAYDIKPSTTKRSISTSAYKLSKSPNIARELNNHFQTEQKDILNDHKGTRETVVRELFKLIHSDNEHVKLKALQMLGQSSGLFVELSKQEITTSVSPEKLKDELEKTLLSFDTSKTH